MSLATSEKLSASLEDYLEAIYHLSTEPSVARSKDIAQRLGVSRASVTGALKALSEKQMIHYKPYGYTTLTEKGQRVALRIVRRHELLQQFFETVLGAEAIIAQEAACKAEHTLGPEITARLAGFVEFMTQSQDSGQDVATQFQSYWEHLNES